MVSLLILFFYFMTQAFANIGFISNLEALGHACAVELVIEGLIAVIIMTIKNYKKYDSW